MSAKQAMKNTVAKTAHKQIAGYLHFYNGRGNHFLAEKDNNIQNFAQNQKEKSQQDGSFLENPIEKGVELIFSLG